MTWLAGQGASLFVPIGHAPDYDLIADFGEAPLRVQVKTSRYARRDRWSVQVCTHGGNQSWSGVVKRFAATRCDRLFVLVADVRQWYIPSEEVRGERAILVGGPQYERFEIERGRPLLDLGASDAR